MKKNYILIQNDGEVDINGFELIGASTKRDDNSKIGFFGSGLKYSVAYMLRNGIDFRIFSGETEIKFTTEIVDMRGKPFERICINGKPTSYTTTMGPTWDEDWFVLREIYCNAMDEGNFIVVKNAESIQPSSGKTRIYIESTEKMETVINNWDAYMTDERTPIFTAKSIYTSYLSHEKDRQDIDVYEKTDGIVFRKGVRVAELSTAMFDYGCEHVNINEDRTAKDIGGFSYAIVSIFANFSDKNYIESILSQGSISGEKPMEFECLFSGRLNVKFSRDWVGFSLENTLVVYEISGRYEEQIATSRKQAYLIPSNFAKQLKKALPEVSILGCGGEADGYSFDEIEMTEKQKYLLSDVIKSLDEMQYQIRYNIRIVRFETEHILSMPKKSTGEILLGETVFDKGRRQIALCIMIENEFMASGAGDKNAFYVSHMASEWLKFMENKNALFL